MARQEWAELPSRRINPDSQTVDPAKFGIDGVLQFGRCCARTARGLPYRIHAHDCYQLTICTCGTMTFTGANGEIWTLLPGRMLFLPPQTLHRLASNSRGVMRYWLFLPKTFGVDCEVDGLPPQESALLAGMIRRLKDDYPNSNIVAVDYDPGATRINQENRIKLMLANSSRLSGENEAERQTNA